MRPDELFLREMLDAAQTIREVVGDDDAAVLASHRVRRDAVLWNFTVLGEAAAQVSDATKLAAPDIPWAEPVRVRNRIIHGYWGTDLRILVQTAQDDLPAIIVALTRLLAASDSN